MELTRANIGCGSVKPDGWWNVDTKQWDIRLEPRPAHHDRYESAVMNHVLNHLDHHELPPALSNVGMILLPGGTLRVMVPDFLAAVDAYQQSDERWFPQDERTGKIDAKLCTYITWFGTQKSVFTARYLQALLIQAGYRDVTTCRFKQTCSNDRHITDLDDREHESIFMEAIWP